jgi:predicted nucleotidyltransferase component of viral defense system
MIPKAELLAVAAEAGLLPATVEKDYVLGWTLYGIAGHPELSRWIFKGGTCLKKCYFDTYRFSEDLDFTISPTARYDANAIGEGLRALASWMGDQVGIEVLAEEIEVTESVNKRGQVTFQARMTFRGPLSLPRQSRQRIRFDLTQDELIADAPALRPIFHGYSDARDSAPAVLCYSLEELLAEKVRALVERSGRARDVYDVVNVGRNFADRINVARARDCTTRKFAFKALAPPTPERVLARIDAATLATDWDNALRHQLQVLPPVGNFLTALNGVLTWILVPAFVAPRLTPVPSKASNEALVPAVRFERPALGLGRAVSALSDGIPTSAYGRPMERIRFAARNRLLARVVYDGVSRLVEPYSLRMPGTGNLLLYVYEVERGDEPGGGIRAFIVGKMGEVAVTPQPFQPRYVVEL